MGRELAGLCAREVWRQSNREQTPVARCTVERLMGFLGLQGAIRARPARRRYRTMCRSGPLISCNDNSRQTVQIACGWWTLPTVPAGPVIFVAFVVDVFARRIVGWWVAGSMRAELVLDVLEQASWSRTGTEDLVHHSGRGSQCLSIGYSYDNALAETIIGLFETEVIRWRGRWRTIDTAEYATLEWGDWFNHRRLLEPIDNIPPAQLEQAYYRQLEESAVAA